MHWAYIAAIIMSVASIILTIVGWRMQERNARLEAQYLNKKANSK